MLNVKNLSAEDKLILGNMNRHHSSYASRMRAHAVLLSDTGFSLTELSDTFGVCRQTAATWLNDWEAGGASALLDKPRSGRPCKLLKDIKQDVIGLIKESPRSLKTVLAQLSEKQGITVSCATLKRLCKQEKLCWKRGRKSLGANQQKALKFHEIVIWFSFIFLSDIFSETLTTLSFYTLSNQLCFNGV
jgi:transposase